MPVPCLCQSVFLPGTAIMPEYCHIPSRPAMTTVEKLSYESGKPTNCSLKVCDAPNKTHVIANQSADWCGNPPVLRDFLWWKAQYSPATTPHFRLFPCQRRHTGLPRRRPSGVAPRNDVFFFTVLQTTIFRTDYITGTIYFQHPGGYP